MPLPFFPAGNLLSGLTPLEKINSSCVGILWQPLSSTDYSAITLLVKSNTMAATQDKRFINEFEAKENVLPWNSSSVFSDSFFCRHFHITFVTQF